MARKDSGEKMAIAPQPSTFAHAPPSKPPAPLTAAVFEPMRMPSVARVERLGLGLGLGMGLPCTEAAAAEEEDVDAAPLPKLEMSLVRFHANNPSWQPSSREQQALLQSADLCVGHALASVGAQGAGALLGSRLQPHSPGHLASLYRSRLAASSLSLAGSPPSACQQQQEEASLLGDLHSSAAPAALYASQLVGNEYLAQHMTQSPVPPNPQVYMVCGYLTTYDCTSTSMCSCFMLRNSYSITVALFAICTRIVCQFVRWFMAGSFVEIEYFLPVVCSRSLTRFFSG